MLSDDYKKGSFTVRDFPLIHGEQGVRVAANVDRTYYWRDFVYYAGIGTPGLEDADDARILADAKNRLESNYGGRDWFVLGTGLEWELTKRLSVNANYDVMFNRHMALHTGSGGLTYRW